MSGQQRRRTTVRAAIESRAILEGLPTRVARTCPWHLDTLDRVAHVDDAKVVFGCGCVLRLQEEAGADPEDWAAIRTWILRRARHACEGSPAYPDCRAPNYQPHPVTGSKVVLTIAHIDQMPEHNDPENLRAWCQRCHLRHDRDWRAMVHGLATAITKQVIVDAFKLDEAGGR